MEADCCRCRCSSSTTCVPLPGASVQPARPVPVVVHDEAAGELFDFPTRAAESQGAEAGAAAGEVDVVQVWRGEAHHWCVDGGSFVGHVEPGVRQQVKGRKAEWRSGKRQLCSMRRKSGPHFAAAQYHRQLILIDDATDRAAGQAYEW